jgi:hypothetical protein
MPVSEQNNPITDGCTYQEATRLGGDFRKIVPSSLFPKWRAAWVLPHRRTRSQSPYRQQEMLPQQAVQLPSHSARTQFQRSKISSYLTRSRANKVVNMYMLARRNVARGFADGFAIFDHYCAVGNGDQSKLVA